jgi:hypothetical protein
MHVWTTTDKHRAYALRLHCFWEYPVAQAVVAEIQRGLPARAAPPVSPADVWLLQPPPGRTVHTSIWAIVCMVALRAMELGRCNLWDPALAAVGSAVVPPPGLCRSPGGPRQMGGRLGTPRHPFIGIVLAAGIDAALGDRCLRLNLPVGLALPPDLDLLML